MTKNTKDELKELLKENLKITIDTFSGYGGSGLKVRLTFDGEEIDSSDVYTEYYSD